MDGLRRDSVCDVLFREYSKVRGYTHCCALGWDGGEWREDVRLRDYGASRPVSQARRWRMRFRLEPIRKISERAGQVMNIAEETGVVRAKHRANVRT